MGRDKNPSLAFSCIVCRQRLLNTIKINGGGTNDDVLRFRALSLDAFFMLFGLPGDHPFTSMFIHNYPRKAKLCNECFQDSNDAQYIFWQLSKLEGRLLDCQDRIFKRLKSNYDAAPVATLFSTIGVADIKQRFNALSYYELVKILFDSIRDRKEEWPKSNYSSSWRQARDNASRVSEAVLTETPHSMQDSHSVQESDLNLCTFKFELDHSMEEIHNPSDNEEIVLTNITGSTETLSGRIKTTSKSPVKIKKDRSEDGSQDQDYWDDPDDLWVPDNEHVRDVRKRHNRRISASKTKAKGKRNSPKKIKALTVSQDGKQMYECMEDPAICSKTYSSIKQLQSHIRSFHAEKKFPCDGEGCKRSFNSEEMLETHKTRAHVNKEEKAKQTEVCDMCGVSVPRKDLKNHYFLRHIGVGKFSCDTCSMDFNDPVEFATHEMQHKNSEFPFMCVVCQNLFTNSQDLKSHVSSNHMSSGLKCEKCGVMKANEYLLQRHMKLHEKTKRFICECGKAFTSRGYLSYHKEHFHTNVGKTFPCEICGKTFLHMKNAVRHLVTHREDKPFKCKICSKTFNYSHLLKKHEEIHSGTKNYGCEVCGKRFRQEQNLTQHMKSHKPKPAKPSSKKPVKSNRKSRVSPSPTFATGHEDDDEGNVPVILGIKGDADGPKIENEIIIDDSELVSKATLTLPMENLPGQFETVHEIREIQINHGDMDSQTATVLFVTTDPNFQWIT